MANEKPLAVNALEVEQSLQRSSNPLDKDWKTRFQRLIQSDNMRDSI